MPARHGIAIEEEFADAIEAAANDKTPVARVSARVLTNPRDIAKFMQRCRWSK